VNDKSTGSGYLVSRDPASAEEAGALVQATLNGEPVRLAPGTTVLELVMGVQECTRGVAVAVDREVLPRSCWEEAVVREGSVIEIVTAAAGG